MRRLAGVSVALVFVSLAAWGGTGAWNVDGDGVWSNGANWVGGAVADGWGSTAYFTNYVTARRTVAVDQQVTVEALRFSSPTNNNWRLIGDGPIFLDGASKPRLGSTVNQRVEIFTPLAGTNGFIQESQPGDIELDGNNSRIQGLGDLRAYTVIQSMSKTADDASGISRNYFPTGGVIMGGARFELWGRKNGSAAASSWTLAAGSALAQSASATATASLAPGQAVTGTGVPGGAFIRQILDGSNLVLSAAADQSVTSTLTFAAANFRSEQLLQRVRVDSSQTFKVYKNGGTSYTVSVDRVFGTAAWALKEGDGVVSIPGQREHRNAIQLQSGDLTLAPRTVSRQPAPGASFHVDASQAGTLSVVEGGKVAEWRDADGKDLWAKMPTTATNGWPTLLSNELNGKPVVDFGTFGTSPYMHWFTSAGRTQLTNIYAVFWVLGSQNGGGFLLGGASTAHFHRGNHPAGVGSDAFEPVMASSYLWEHDWNTYPGDSRVETYIDGIKRDRLAALSGGYQLITCVITTNCTAGGFATDRDGFPGRRGGQRLAEVLIYERPVTERERIETEEYLTAKWFGDTRWDAGGKDPYVTDLNAIGARTLNTPDTGVTALGHLSGSGKLTKTGVSTLAVADAQEYLGTLALSGGSLKVDVAAVPSVPASNAFFHVDASLTNTFTLDANGRIAEWQDWRANGLKATVPPGFKAPALANGISSGKAVVDFGSIGSLQTLAWNHTNTSIRAAFVVFQSLANLSPILGSMTNSTDFYRGASGQLYISDLNSSRAVAYGANYVNGWKVEPTLAALPASLCVVSVIPTTPARASAFAYSITGGYSGGQRLAEVIVYTRALTDQERRDTEAYLMRKWLNRAAPGYGFEGTALLPSVAFAGSTMNVEVAGNGTATIGQLTGCGKVVKTGTGTLSFGNNGMAVLGGEVRVSGGAVSVATPGSSAPAAFPAFHVDASQTNTLTIVAENGTNFITRWASIGAVSNAAVERAGYKRPFILTNDLAGLPTVGFGPYGGSYNACLKWETSLSSIRSAFLVLGSQEGGGFVLGAAGSCNFHRGGVNGVLNPVTTNSPMLGFDVSATVTGGAVYLDGSRVASPTSQLLSGGYQLVEFMTTDNTAVDLFAADRGFTDRAGGQRLAEVIVYDRLLTEAERKQTEAYLSKKWFGRTSASAGLGTVVVADGVGLGASGAPVLVNRLEGSGTVVKGGDNTLTVVDTTAFTGTVDVAAGTLNLAVPAAPVTPPTNALFWADASKAGSFDFDASGNVVTWRDATGNGRYATSLSGHLPTLRSGEFLGRPIVDFGAYGTSGGAMYWSQRLTGLKTVVWLLGSQQSGGYLLGVTNGTCFHRGRPPNGGEIAVTNFTYQNKMLAGDWGAIVPSSAYTNGVAVDTTTTPLSGGYQSIVMSWSSTTTYADGFAFDRTIGDRYGGQRLAEFVAYDRVLTDAERLATDAYLNWKWFGRTTPGYPRPATQTAVLLRAGAALAMNGTEQSVTDLSGLGAVSNGTLVITGTLSPGFSSGEVAALPVFGNLTLASNVVYVADVQCGSNDLVAVNGALAIQGRGTLSARLPDLPGSGWAGRVAVLTFGSIDGADNLASWSVTGLPAGYTGRLSVEGTTVYLEIHAKGTLISVR